MKEMYFTKGPWIISDNNGFGVNIWNESGNKCIAERVRLSDARLIIAAPELLELLNQQLADNPKNNPDLCHCDLCERTRAVIAKAEGK